MNLRIPPENLALSKMAGVIRYQLAPDFMGDGVMVVHLSEEKLLQVLSKMAEEFSNIFGLTGIQKNPLKIDRIIVTLGDYRIEATEDIEVVHKVQSNGFKKVVT